MYVLPSVGNMHENSAYLVPMPFSPMHLSGIFAITLFIVISFFVQQVLYCCVVSSMMRRLNLIVSQQLQQLILRFFMSRVGMHPDPAAAAALAANPRNAWWRGFSILCMDVGFSNGTPLLSASFEFERARGISEIKQQQNEINGCSRNGPLGTLGRASSDVPR